VAGAELLYGPPLLLQRYAAAYSASGNLQIKNQY